MKVASRTLNGKGAVNRISMLAETPQHCGRKESYYTTVVAAYIKVCRLVIGYRDMWGCSNVCHIIDLILHIVMYVPYGRDPTARKILSIYEH